MLDRNKSKAQLIQELAALREQLAEHERTERALCESETKYRTLFESASDAMFLMQDQCFVECNAQAEKLFGCPRDALIGQTPSAFSPPRQPDGSSSKARSREKVRSALNGTAQRFEWTHRRLDGSLFESEISLNRTEIGDQSYVLAIARDITERKQLEREIEKRKLYLERVLACAPDAILTLDAQHRILEWNAGAERLFGYTAQEAIGHNPDDLLAGSAEMTKQVLSGQPVSPTEGVRYRKDGTPLDVIVAGAPIVANDQLLGVIGVYTDITETKRLEAQLRHAQKMEAVGRLAGGIAHDFNNLLTAIQGYAQLLLDEFTPQSPIAVRYGESGAAWLQGVRADLKEIERTVDRAASLTRQLLAFSRKQVMQPQVLDLNSLVNHTEKMLMRLIGEDIELSMQLDPALGKIEADPGQIEQVIVNLAVNARDAMPQGGQLVIETANVTLDEYRTHEYVDLAPGEYVILAMHDVGIGMDEHVRAHLFEPFFTTKAETGGTGLGLATAYGIVRQSGGDIEVQSELGQGTTFKIYLPRTKMAPDRTKAVLIADSFPKGSETLLLVEDEEQVRLLAYRVLTRQGYTVIKAHHPEQAVQLCQEHTEKIHLLLTDVVMPGMGGRELVQRLAPAYPEMKVLYMSGYTDDAIVRYGVLEQNVAFLPKPFGPAALARKVREVLDAPGHTLRDPQ